MDPETKSLNFIFPSKYVIPKSLKFSHWPSKQLWNQQLPIVLCDGASIKPLNLRPKKSDSKIPNDAVVDSVDFHDLFLCLLKMRMEKVTQQHILPNFMVSLIVLNLMLQSVKKSPKTNPRFSRQKQKSPRQLEHRGWFDQLLHHMNHGRCGLGKSQSKGP